MSNKNKETGKKSKSSLFFRLLSCLLSWLLILELIPPNALASIDYSGQEEFPPQPVQVSQSALTSHAEESYSITEAFFDASGKGNVRPAGAASPVSITPSAKGADSDEERRRRIHDNIRSEGIQRGYGDIGPGTSATMTPPRPASGGSASSASDSGETFSINTDPAPESDGERTTEGWITQFAGSAGGAAMGITGLVMVLKELAAGVAFSALNPVAAGLFLAGSLAFGLFAVKSVSEAMGKVFKYALAYPIAFIGTAIGGIVAGALETVSLGFLDLKIDNPESFFAKTYNIATYAGRAIALAGSAAMPVIAGVGLLGSITSAAAIASYAAGGFSVLSGATQLGVYLHGKAKETEVRENATMDRQISRLQEKADGLLERIRTIEQEIFRRFSSGRQDLESLAAAVVSVTASRPDQQSASREDQISYLSRLNEALETYSARITEYRTSRTRQEEQARQQQQEHRTEEQIRRLVEWKRQQMEQEGRGSQFHAERWQEYFGDEARRGRLDRHLGEMEADIAGRRNTGIIRNALDNLPSASADAQFVQSQQQIIQARQELAGVGQFWEVFDPNASSDADPGDLIFDPLIGSSVGILQFNDHGRPEITSFDTDSENYPSQILFRRPSEMSSRGPVTSLEMELRRCHDEGCSNFYIHDAIDQAAASGAPVRAASAGRVVYTGYDTETGNKIFMDNGQDAEGNLLFSRTIHYGRSQDATGILVRPGEEVE
ncbi:MAG: hypothetical protein HY747_04885, partial [Elusimicrobia bacterium]|nr:hypothetical protein [Elusimicrobiota bacterium]